MIYIPQKLLFQTDCSTLSLLMIAPDLGKGKVFVHRQDGQIVSVEDSDWTFTRYQFQAFFERGETLIAQYTEDNAPESHCEVRMIESSDGGFYLEFLTEKTVVKKVLGGYDILRQPLPKQQVGDASTDLAPLTISELDESVSPKPAPPLPAPYQSNPPSVTDLNKLLDLEVDDEHSDL